MANLDIRNAPLGAQSDLDLATLQVGDVSGGNYFDVEADGTWESVGDATTWDDFSISAALAKQGQQSKPDYDFTNLGLLFPQNDDAEIAYIVAQMSHSKLMDSDIYFHIHFIQDEAQLPTFKIDYKFYLNGGLVPGGWTTISTANGSKGIFAYTAGSMLQIATFPAIFPPDNETVSANIDIKIYRDDNDVAGDVLVKYIDFHYEIDMSGSREQLSK